MVTVFGAGLLVGTALTVIIPEGIRALYSDMLSHNHIHNVNPGSNTLNPVSSPLLSEEPVEHSSTIGLSLVLGNINIIN